MPLMIAAVLLQLSAATPAPTPAAPASVNTDSDSRFPLAIHPHWEVRFDFFVVRLKERGLEQGPSGVVSCIVRVEGLRSASLSAVVPLRYCHTC